MRDWLLNRAAGTIYGRVHNDIYGMILEGTFITLHGIKKIVVDNGELLIIEMATGDRVLAYQGCKKMEE